MDDGSQHDLRNCLYGELAEAYDGFFKELVQATRIWGFWVGRRRIAGPYSAWGVARIYQVVLLVFFVAGVILSVLSPGNQGLGSALVVGSLFAAGAWIAQLWICRRRNGSGSATSYLARSGCCCHPGIGRLLTWHESSIPISEMPVIMRPRSRI